MSNTLRFRKHDPREEGRYAKNQVDIDNEVYGNKKASKMNMKELQRNKLIKNRKGTAGDMAWEKHQEEPARRVPKEVWERLKHFEKTAKSPKGNHYRPLDDAYETEKGYYRCPGMRSLPLPRYGENHAARRRKKREMMDLTGKNASVLPQETINWADEVEFVPKRVADSLAEDLANLKLAQSKADALFK
mgnify:FL=1